MKTRQAQESDLEAWVKLRHELWPEQKVDALLDEAKSILASPDEVCFLLINPSEDAFGFVEGAIHQRWTRKTGPFVKVAPT